MATSRKKKERLIPIFRVYSSRHRDVPARSGPGLDGVLLGPAELELLEQVVHLARAEDLRVGRTLGGERQGGELDCWDSVWYGDAGQLLLEKDRDREREREREQDATLLRSKLGGVHRFRHDLEEELGRLGNVHRLLVVLLEKRGCADGWEGGKGAIRASQLEH